MTCDDHSQAKLFGLIGWVQGFTVWHTVTSRAITMDDDVLGMWERWGNGTAHAQNAVLGRGQVVVQKGQPDGFVVCLFFFFLPFLTFIFN